MGKYYQTTPSQQVDYTVDPRLYAAMSGALGRKTPTKAASKDILGAQVSVVPDDIPAYTEVRKEYEGEISDLTSQISKNPNGYKSLQPRIDQLRQKMQADQQPGGRLYAFNERANQWNGYLEQAKKAAGDDADLYGFNVERISAGDQGYIDEFGKPIPIKAGFTTAWDQKAEQDYLKSIKTTITPKLLRDAEVKKLEIGSKYKDAVSVMTDLGYSKEDVADYIAGSITPDMLKSMKHSFDYAQARGNIGKEAKFEDYLVGKVNTWTDAIEGTKSAQRQTVTSDTDLAMREKAKRAASAGDKEFVESWFPLVDVMKDAVKNPDPQLRAAIKSKKNEFIPIQSATDAFVTQAAGSNFGIDNNIVGVAYNPSTGKFYYKGLYDLRKGNSPNKEWVELSTATLDNLKGNAKFDVERFARKAKKEGILGKNNLFDFSGVTPEDEGDINDDF